MLQRKARMAAQPVSGHEPEAAEPAFDVLTALHECDAGDRWSRNRGWLGTREQRAYLDRWVDDGGSVPVKDRSEGDRFPS